tara:strand:+ start:26848 stop:29022 length:2175 start_codon:yes stop_codon:yes gene_type:complete
VKLKKLFENIIILLLSVILVLKLSIINSSILEPIEFGELQIDNKYSQTCKIEYEDVKDLSNIGDSGLETAGVISFLRGDSCGHYWRINGMRGFYIHHYSALFKEIDFERFSFKNFSNIINHQYGLITLFFPSLLLNLNIEMKIQTFAAYSLFFGIALNLLIIYIAKIKNILSNTEFINTIIILVLAFSLVNSQQFLLSPGFGPIRVVPINLITLGIIGISRKKINNNIFTWIFFYLVSLCMSPQFEILIASSIGLVLFLSFFIKRISIKKVKQLIDENIIYLKNIFLIILFSIFSKFLSLILVGEDNQIFSSSITESVIHKKAFIIFALIYYGIWTLAGQFSDSSRDNNKNINNKLNLLTPLSFIPIFLFLYPSKFWGSPNHFVLYLMATCIPFGIIVANILTLEINIDLNNFLLKFGKNKTLLFICNLLSNKFFISKTKIDSLTLMEIFIKLYISLISYLLIFISTIFLFWRPSGFFSISQVFISELKLLNKSRNEIPKNVLAKPFYRQFWLRRNCEEKYININAIKMRSCSISNDELPNIKVSVSKNKNINKYIYLSDNADVLTKKLFPRIISGSTLGSSEGKLAIIENPKIQETMKQSFYNFDSYISLINTKRESDNLLNNKVFLNKTLNDLKKELFDKYDYEEKLSKQGLIFDKKLFTQTLQIYLYAYSLWRGDPKLNPNNVDVLEAMSKVYKYLWRLQLIENRSKEGYELIENVVLGDF